MPPHCARGSVRSSEATFAWLSAQFSCHCSILSPLAAVDGGRCPIHKVNFTKGVNEWGETRSGRASETPAADPRPARSASVTWRGLRALSAGEGSWLRLVTNTTSVKRSTAKQLRKPRCACTYRGWHRHLAALEHTPFRWDNCICHRNLISS